MKLTETQRRALRLCANHPTRAILPGHQLTRFDMSYTTALHLMQCSYTQSIPRPQDEPANVAGIYIVTTAGRAALAVPIQDKPIYLSARIGGKHGDYTTVAALGARGEPQPVDLETLAKFTKQSHAIRDLKELGDIERARQQTIRAIREAERVDVDHLKLRPVLKRLRANLADLERQLKRAA